MNLKNKIGMVLHRSGVSADLLTVLGTLLAFFAGAAIYYGYFFQGAVLILFSGGLDLLDGATARASGRPGYFGGIFDSSLDRYADAFIFGGVLFFCASTGRALYAVLAFSALLGAFSVSYVRARAECELEDCRVGFWERGERLVFLALGFLTRNPGFVLWVLALGPHFTALSRLFYASQARQETGKTTGRIARYLAQNTGRGTTRYALKLLALALFLMFWRIPF